MRWVASLADLIEGHIKRLLALAGEDTIEIRRRELAEQFACVPSQINYVLATRFTPERGYLVETRRGGAGYVRIERIRWSRPDFAKVVYGRGTQSLSEEEAHHLLLRLCEAGLLTEERMRRIRHAMEREVDSLPAAWKGPGRALFLKGSLLMALLED